MTNRGFAPVKLDKSKLVLCKRHREQPLDKGADILASCKGCGKTVVSQLWYCSVCAKAKNICQICPSAAAAAQDGNKKKERGTKKISLIEFMKAEGKKASQEWEEYLADYAQSVSEGFGARARKDDLNSIRISRSPRIDVDERRQVNAVLSEHGYGPETRDVTIGEIYRLAKEHASNNNR